MSLLRDYHAFARGLGSTLGISPVRATNLALYSGQASEFSYTGTIAVGDVVMQNTADASVVERCGASDTAIGAVLVITTATTSCIVQHAGVTPENYSGLTVGAQYYAAAAGAVADTGTIKVGKALSDKKLIMNPEWLVDVTGVDSADDLTDVTLTSPSTGQVLVYDGSVFANVYPDQLRDADGDTLVQVEESADEDILRIDLGGTQIVAMQTAVASTNASQTLIAVNPSVNQSGSAGYIGLDFDVTETAVGSGAQIVAQFGSGGSDHLRVYGDATSRLGGSANYVKIEADGTIQLLGDATGWEDLRVPATSAVVGAAPPDLGAFGPSGGLKTYLFDKATDQEVHLAVQLPHTWEEASNITPHVHWSPVDTNTGTVRWGLEYSWANMDGTFGAPSTIYAEDAGDGTAWKHQVKDFSALDATGKTISSMIVCRLFRDADHANDTYDNDAALLECDFHYEIDTPAGSRAITTK